MIGKYSHVFESSRVETTRLIPLVLETISTSSLEFVDPANEIIDVFILVNWASRVSVTWKLAWGDLDKTGDTTCRDHVGTLKIFPNPKSCTPQRSPRAGFEHLWVCAYADSSTGHCCGKFAL